MEPIAAPGTFFDGTSARPHPVTLRLGTRLEIVGDGVRRDWDLLDLRASDAAAPLTRILHAPGPESCEFTDAALAGALAERCPDLRRADRQGAGLARLVLWSVVAGVSVLAAAIYGVPAAAGLIAPLVPAPVEAQIGRSVDGQIVDLLGKPPLCADAPGRAALDRLIARLTEGAALPMPPQVSVRRHAEANALTLPGGRVIVLSDIIAKAKTPDELAGILAHEFGHVAGRDPVRAVITAGGTSFLLSLVLGDFTGSTVIVALGQAAISAGYSREAENAADAYAVAAVTRAGGDGAAFAALLERLTGAETAGGTDFLRSHPFTHARAAAIRSLAGQAAVGTPKPGPLLAQTEWEALRRICPPSAEAPKSRPGPRGGGTPD